MEVKVSPRPRVDLLSRTFLIESFKIKFPVHEICTALKELPAFRRHTVTDDFNIT